MKKNMVSTINDKQNVSCINPDRSKIVADEKSEASSKLTKKSKNSKLKMRDAKIHIEDDVPSTDKNLLLKENKSSNNSEKEKNIETTNINADTNQDLISPDKKNDERKNVRKKSKKNLITDSSSDSEEGKESESNKETNKKWYKAYYLTNLSMKLQHDIDAVKYGDEMLMTCDEVLNKDQINIILAANALYMTKLRKAHRQLVKILIEAKEGKNLINEIKIDKEKKIIERCHQFIKVINDYILIREYPKEIKALYLKTKADYYRYLAEVTHDHDLYINKQNALHFYMEAKELTKDLDHLNSTKLDVALNYSVFLNEIMSKRINSYFAAKEAVFNALSDLKNCTEEELAAEEMRDSLVCIEILNRNVENWYNEEMEADNEEAERKKKELMEKNEQKEKGNLITDEIKEAAEGEGEQKSEEEEEKEEDAKESEELVENEKEGNLIDADASKNAVTPRSNNNNENTKSQIN